MNRATASGKPPVAGDAGLQRGILQRLPGHFRTADAPALSRSWQQFLVKSGPRDIHGPERDPTTVFVMQLACQNLPPYLTPLPVADFGGRSFVILRSLPWK
jgi:hypothetical protein